MLLDASLISDLMALISTLTGIFLPNCNYLSSTVINFSFSTWQWFPIYVARHNSTLTVQVKADSNHGLHFTCKQQHEFSWTSVEFLTSCLYVLQQFLKGKQSMTSHSCNHSSHWGYTENSFPIMRHSSSCSKMTNALKHVLLSSRMPKMNLWTTGKNQPWWNQYVILFLLLWMTS